MIHTAQHSDPMATFERDGYCVVRGLVDPATVADLRALAWADLGALRGPLEFEADVHYPGSPAAREAPGGQTVRRLLGAAARDARFRAWALASRAAHMAAALIGDPQGAVFVQAHHNCVMTKAPRYSSDTLWHQDIRYWRYERPDLVTTWLALTPEQPANGGLRVLPGTHHVVDASWLDERQFLRSDRPETRRWLATECPLTLAPGDVLFFHALLFHAASRNHTDETKLSLVCTYKGVTNAALAGSRSATLPELALTR